MRLTEILAPDGRVIYIQYDDEENECTGRITYPLKREKRTVDLGKSMPIAKALMRPPIIAVMIKPKSRGAWVKAATLDGIIVMPIPSRRPATATH